MADINVERKGGGGGMGKLLPLLLGLLLLGGLAWFLLGRGDDDEVETETTTTTVVDSVNGDPAMTGTTAPTTETGAPMTAPAGMPASGAVDSAGGDNIPEGPAGNP